jgi:hypothetical protein
LERPFGVLVAVIAIIRIRDPTTVGTGKYVLFDGFAAWEVTAVLGVVLFLYVSQQPSSAGTTADLGQHQSTWNWGQSFGKNVLFPAFVALVGGAFADSVASSLGSE